MCLSISSLDDWIENNKKNLIIPYEDLIHASLIYNELWPKLDHSRRYCLNPLILAAEILEYIGEGYYPQVVRFQGEKGRKYKETINLMLSKL